MIYLLCKHDIISVPFIRFSVYHMQSIYHTRQGISPETKRERISLKKLRRNASEFFNGAGDEARTRYLHLGKVALYRMSYTRNGHGLL